MPLSFVWNTRDKKPALGIAGVASITELKIVIVVWSDRLCEERWPRLAGVYSLHPIAWICCRRRSCHWILFSGASRLPLAQPARIQIVADLAGEIAEWGQHFIPAQHVPEVAVGIPEHGLPFLQGHKFYRPSKPAHRSSGRTLRPAGALFSFAGSRLHRRRRILWVVP